MFDKVIMYNEKIDERWPRKKNRDKIYSFLVAGLFCFFVSLFFLSQYLQIGCIGIPQGAYETFYVHGNEAIATILLLVFGGLSCLVLSVIYYLRLQYLIKTNQIKEDEPIPSKFVICIRCKEVFEGYLVVDDNCPKCDGQVISTDEYHRKYSYKSSSSYKWNKKWILFIVLFSIIFGLIALNQFILYVKINKCKENGGRYNLELDKCYKYRGNNYDYLGKD